MTEISISPFNNTLSEKKISNTLPATPQVRNRAKIAGVILALIAFIGTVSYVGFMKQSLRLDESQSLWQSSHSPGMVLRIIAGDVHVPLYGLLLHFWQLEFGNGVTAARLLSLIFYMATIPATYLLARKIFNWGTSIFATILIATSPFLNWYGNETRMYSMLTFVTVINQLFFIQILQHTGSTQSSREGNVLHWIGYCASALIGMYTHYFFAFVLVSQALFFFAQKKQFPANTFRKLVIVAVIVLLAFAPWLWFVKHLGLAANTQPHLTQPTSIDLFNTFSQFLFGFQDDHLNTILVSLWPLTILFGFLALRKNKKVPPEVMYFFTSAFIPILGAFFLSIFIKPFYLSRYLILAAPSLYLFIAWILSVYPKRLQLSFQVILISFMIAMLGVQVVNAATPVKENYRQATDYLNNHATSNDIIIISSPFTIYPIEYYYTGPAAITTLPIWNNFVSGAIPNFSPEKLPSEIDKIKTDHEVLYLALSYDQGYEQEIKNYFDTHFQKISEEHFSKDLNLYVYKVGQQ
jgi:mannosyltransferase